MQLARSHVLAERLAGTSELKLVFAVAFGLALILAWLPIEWTVGRFLYDDMFYYLRVAQHIAAGSGSTFDGVEPTNGFHPLWMLLCVFFALLLSGNALVHAVLTVAAVLHVAQGIVLSRILSEYVRYPLVLLLTGLYLLNWRTLAINLCGLESALATLVALLIVKQLLLADVSSSIGRSFAMGLLLGLGVLARFDLLLLAGFGCLWILLESREHMRRPLVQRLQSCGAAVAGVVLMLLPWFAFSWRTSGSLLPNSRHAVKFLSGIEYDPTNVLQIIEQLGKQLRSFVWWSSDIANMLGLFPFVSPYGKGMYVAALLVFGTFVGVTGGLIVFRAERRARLALLVMLYCSIHAGYYAVFHRVELRYILPAIALFLIPAGILVELLLKRYDSATTRKVFAATAAGVALSVTIAGLVAAERGHGSVRAHKYHYVAHDMATWLAKNHPNAIVGSWNAGVLSYFSQTQLVNLDGVINDAALKALGRGRIGDYIIDRGITLIVEEPSQMDHNLAKFDRSRPCCEILGPIVHTARDNEGRQIIARTVIRKQHH